MSASHSPRLPQHEPELSREPDPGPPGFEEFFRHCAPMVRKYLIWREAEQSILDDTVQMTMLRAYRHWDTVGAMDDPKGWLFKVAGQRLHDAREKYWRHGVPTDAATLRERLTQPDPIQALDRSREIMTAIRKLPALRQEALVLKHQFGFDYNEIANIMGAAPATIRALVHQAKQSLETILGESTEEGSA